MMSRSPCCGGTLAASSFAGQPTGERMCDPTQFWNNCFCCHASHRMTQLKLDEETCCRPSFIHVSKVFDTVHQSISIFQLCQMKVLQVKEGDPQCSVLDPLPFTPHHVVQLSWTEYSKVSISFPSWWHTLLLCSSHWDDKWPLPKTATSAGSAKTELHFSNVYWLLTPP